jgi:hypothetical protein
LSLNNNYIYQNIMAHYHPYHLVEPSPYPYMASFGALGLTTGSVL